MLRIILSVTGVGLIVLGLFGGRPLDEFYTRVSGKTRHLVEVPAAVVTDTTSVNGNAANIADNKLLNVPVLTPEVIASEVENNDGQIEVPQVAKKSDVPARVNIVPSPQVKPASQQASQSNAAISTMGDAAETEQVIAISDEQKASRRNNQVALAKDILNSTGQAEPQPATPISKDKIAQDKNVAALAMASATGSADGEVLLVIKDKVNLREGPSINHPIVMQLAQGQELMEFKREGRWVHVGAYGTAGKIGWVHQRLVGSAR